MDREPTIQDVYRKLEDVSKMQDRIYLWLSYIFILIIVFFIILFHKLNLV